MDTPANTMKVDRTINITAKKASLRGTPNISMAATVHPRQGIPMMNARVLGNGAVNSSDSQMMIAESNPIEHSKWRKDNVIPDTMMVLLISGCVSRFAMAVALSLLVN